MVDKDLTSVYCSAKHPQRADVLSRPPGTTDATVAARGKLSEAREIVDHARGCVECFGSWVWSAEVTVAAAGCERGGTKRYEAIGLAVHAAAFVVLLLLVMSSERTPRGDARPGTVRPAFT